VDFVAEWTEAPLLEEEPVSCLLGKEDPGYCVMCFDGAFSIKGAGAGVLVVYPMGEHLKYVVQLAFFREGSTNNMDDVDIPITPPLPPTPFDDEDVATKKSNETRIGPITRARAKLLEQQVMSLLIEHDLLFTENFILPKSMHLLGLFITRALHEEEMSHSKKSRT
jgi:hypothetical protein